MKEQYVSGLREGMKVDSLFALRSRDIRSARTGDSYLSVDLGDRTGAIRAVLFRPSSSDEGVPVGAVVRVRGTVTSFRGVRRISIASIDPVTAFDRDDLLASGVRERTELLSELRSLVRRVADRGLRALLNEVFGSPGFVERFSSAPATCGSHHPFVGGLLEHTVAVAGLCVRVAAPYPLVDRDLLLTAALLHDAGVVDALEYETSVGLSDAGRLIGHVALGDRMVAAAAARLSVALPRESSLRLSHAMLTHHGGPGDDGPRSLEAVLLRAVNEMDAAASTFIGAMTGAALLQDRWTDAANPFARELLVPGVAPPGESGFEAASRCA